jgi:hypothetical protein
MTRFYLRSEYYSSSPKISGHSMGNHVLRYRSTEMPCFLTENVDLTTEIIAMSCKSCSNIKLFFKDKDNNNNIKEKEGIAFAQMAFCSGF